jgi:hypothetical protein
VSTDLLVPPVAAPATPAKRKKKRRRRRFSLNGLAIQLSAFALSFTLVALLVVSGSQAAFVEENEVLADYVPIGTTATPTDERGPTRRPSSPIPTTAEPTPSVAPDLTPEPEQEPAPEPEAEPEPVVVELTDSDAGTAMFVDGVPLAPGVTEERCIEVAYRGVADPRPVKLYATGISGALAGWLDLTVDIGRAAPGSFGSCSSFVPTDPVYTGTLADFDAAHGSYATGVPTWDPAEAQETRHFRFTVAVQDDPAAAGLSATFGFSWATRDDV